MNQQTGVLKLSVQETRERSRISRKLSAILGLSAALLIVLAAFGAAAAGKPAGNAADAVIAADPESEMAKAAFLAANPEVRICLRHAATVAAKVEADFVAANPEARVYLRHVAEMATKPEVDFLTANPEVRVYLRHIAEIAAKPEVDFLRRQPGSASLSAVRSRDGGEGRGRFPGRQPGNRCGAAAHSRGYRWRRVGRQPARGLCFESINQPSSYRGTGSRPTICSPVPL
jgi:hypothetical protein